jgi:hypothetical protein
MKKGIAEELGKNQTNKSPETPSGKAAISYTW